MYETQSFVVALTSKAWTFNYPFWDVSMRYEFYVIFNYNNYKMDHCNTFSNVMARVSEWSLSKNVLFSPLNYVKLLAQLNIFTFLKTFAPTSRLHPLSLNQHEFKFKLIYLMHLHTPFWVEHDVPSLNLFQIQSFQVFFLKTPVSFLCSGSPYWCCFFVYIFKWLFKLITLYCAFVNYSKQNHTMSNHFKVCHCFQLWLWMCVLLTYAILKVSVLSTCLPMKYLLFYYALGEYLYFLQDFKLWNLKSNKLDLKY